MVKSISALLEKQGLSQSRKEPWRLSDNTLGAINGLPQSRGRRVASNGILCLIENELGMLYEGHDNWFVKEPSERSKRHVNYAKDKNDKALAELIALI